ncbi:MAG: hypothetical protein LBR45_04385 [Bacteroidales bacterium]|jgi:hypothetical protein|nr:hypothetical protein [Bacteroidales bacterium]
MAKKIKLRGEELLKYGREVNEETDRILGQRLPKPSYEEEQAQAKAHAAAQKAKESAKNVLFVIFLLIILFIIFM